MSFQYTINQNTTIRLRNKKKSKLEDLDHTLSNTH